MPRFLPTLLFWSAVLAVVLGQLGILRSTHRAWRASGQRVPVTERVFAYGPALLLVAVLWLAWRAATRPPMIEVQFNPTSGEIQL